MLEVSNDDEMNVTGEGVVAAQAYSFAGVERISDIRHQGDGLEPAGRSGYHARVAGRVMLLRRQGRIAFADLRDSSGSIQLLASESVLATFDAFIELNLGDWIGLEGEVITTRRGEVSIEVADWTLLAKARRSFGDKWNGITDVDTRHRQRYVDLWANPEVRETFLKRFRTLSLIRSFLAERDFVEVETPILQGLASGAMARPFITHHNALDVDQYLRIALELPLKRLIVGGFERVFEIGRVFRNEGVSPRHNPEFTMLELYEAYGDVTSMMHLTEDLVSFLAREVTGSEVVSYQGRTVDFTTPWRRVTMEDITSEVVRETVSFEMDPARLEELLRRHGVEPKEAWGPGKRVTELFEAAVEHTLWEPIFVTDYAKEVSPLARDHRSRPDRVERFEAFVAGRELVNAFSELNDPVEQRIRFANQLEAREAGDDEAMLLDEDFIRALEYGMPPTGGLGIGIDRLVMLLTDQIQIREVVLFPTMRPEQDLD